VNRRILALNLIELGIHRLGDADIRGPLGLEHAEGGRRASVEPRDGANLRDAVVHVRDLAQPDGSAAACDDLSIRQILRALGAAEDANRLLSAAHLRAAARRVQIQRPELIVHLDRGQPQRLQARGVELDADLPAHAAAARDLCNPRNRQQALGDGVVDEPAELLGSLSGGGDRVIGDRVPVRILALHQRLHDAERQIAPHLRHGIAHVRHGAIDGRADLELQEDVDGPLDDVGGDVANIADARDRPLHLLSDLRLHFGGGCPGLADGDADYRIGDVRIEIDGQPEECHDAEEEQHHEQHDRRDRVTDRPGGKVLHELAAPTALAAPPAPSATGLTVSPT
jgi:hypothetical protein